MYSFFVSKVTFLIGIDWLGISIAFKKGHFDHLNWHTIFGYLLVALALFSSFEPREFENTMEGKAGLFCLYWVRVGCFLQVGLGIWLRRVTMSEKPQGQPGLRVIHRINGSLLAIVAKTGAILEQFGMWRLGMIGLIIANFVLAWGVIRGWRRGVEALRGQNWSRGKKGVRKVAGVEGLSRLGRVFEALERGAGQDELNTLKVSNTANRRDWFAFEGGVFWTEGRYHPGGGGFVDLVGKDVTRWLRAGVFLIEGKEKGIKLVKHKHDDRMKTMMEDMFLGRFCPRRPFSYGAKGDCSSEDESNDEGNDNFIKSKDLTHQHDEEETINLIGSHVLSNLQGRNDSINSAQPLTRPNRRGSISENESINLSLANPSTRRCRNLAFKISSQVQLGQIGTLLFLSPPSDAGPLGLDLRGFWLGSVGAAYLIKQSGRPAVLGEAVLSLSPAYREARKAALEYLVTAFGGSNHPNAPLISHEDIAESSPFSWSSLGIADSLPLIFPASTPAPLGRVSLQGPLRGGLGLLSDSIGSALLLFNDLGVCPLLDFFEILIGRAAHRHLPPSKSHHIEPAFPLEYTLLFACDLKIDIVWRISEDCAKIAEDLALKSLRLLNKLESGLTNGVLNKVTVIGALLPPSRSDGFEYIQGKLQSDTLEDRGEGYDFVIVNGDDEFKLEIGESKMLDNMTKGSLYHL